MTGRGKGGKGLGKKSGSKKSGSSQKASSRDEIKRNQLRRFALKAGGSRVEAEVYPVMKRIIEGELSDLVRKAATYAGHSKRKTVASKDVEMAVELLGGHIYGDAEGMGPCGTFESARAKSRASRKKSGASQGATPKKSGAKAKRSPAKKSGAKKSGAKKSPAKRSGAKKSGAKRSPAKKSGAKKSPAKKSGGKRRSSGKASRRSQQKFLQKQHDCFIFQQAPLQRLVRRLANDKDLRFSSGAMGMIQLFIEERVLCIFHRANRLAGHAGRSTISSRDVEFIMEFMRPCGGR